MSHGGSIALAVNGYKYLASPCLGFVGCCPLIARTEAQAVESGAVDAMRQTKKARKKRRTDGARFAAADAAAVKARQKQD